MSSINAKFFEECVSEASVAFKKALERDDHADLSGMINHLSESVEKLSRATTIVKAYLDLAKAQINRIC